MATHVFEEVHISKGVRPLAQHGYVAVEDGRLHLLGSDRRLIASSRVSHVSASPARFSGGRTVAVRVNGTRYNVSPRWGERAGHLVRPGRPERVERASEELLRVVEREGGTVADH
ncbi:hypothetical protein ACTWP5_11205 [Streptomyces sp. 4N509B]|uniref:hypothetical protein n=1 Tax=Streptomyces sp. 4N509B TaxID=3457413 RepID=UPI003FD12B6D